MCQDSILASWPKGTKLYIPLRGDKAVTDREEPPVGWKPLGIYHPEYGWQLYEKAAEGKVT